MVEIAVVFLKLPDGRFVFQRRGEKAPTSPKLLGLFGGHIETGETAIEAVERELGEETSILISGITFKNLGNTVIRYNDPLKDRKFFYFEAHIPRSDFEVYEGDRAEVYRIKEALNRQDLTVSTQYGMENYYKDGSTDGK